MPRTRNPNPSSLKPSAAAHARADVTVAADGRETGAHVGQSVLAGVGPLRSAKTAEWMRTNVPGIHIPDALIARMAGSKDQLAEGKQICVELIQEMREIAGIHGVHVMAYRQEEAVAEIIDRSGVLKGRKPWQPGAAQNEGEHRTQS